MHTTEMPSCDMHVLAALARTHFAKHLTACFLPAGCPRLLSGCCFLVRWDAPFVAAFRLAASLSANIWTASPSVSCSHEDSSLKKCDWTWLS